jgi:hypothetical protein
MEMFPSYRLHAIEYRMFYVLCLARNTAPLNVLRRVFLCTRGLHLLYFIATSTGAALFGDEMSFQMLSVVLLFQPNRDACKLNRKVKNNIKLIL